MSLVEYAKQQEPAVGGDVKAPTDAVTAVLVDRPFRFSPDPEQPLTSTELAAKSVEFSDRVNGLHTQVVEYVDLIARDVGNIEYTKAAMVQNDTAISTLSDAITEQMNRKDERDDQREVSQAAAQALLPDLDSLKRRGERARQIYYDTDNKLGVTQAEIAQARCDYENVAFDTLSGPSDEVPLHDQIAIMERELHLIRERTAALRQASMDCTSKHLELMEQRDALSRKGTELRTILQQLTITHSQHQVEAKRLMAAMGAATAVIASQLGNSDV